MRVSRMLWVPLAAALAAGPASGGDAPPAPEAAGDCAAAVAARVQTYYDAVRDLSARFRQTSRVASLDAPGSEESAAEGHVVFAKPGRMRWSYEKPAKSLVVTDGETLWTYDPALREAQRMHVGEAFLSGAAIQFLLGDGRIADAFTVRAEHCGTESVQLDLTPREPATYERLSLDVDPRSGQVQATRVVDLFGNVTEVRFEDIRTNTNPPAKTFQFEPPEGTRVLELEPPPAREPAPGHGP